ncbi:hypothetical protein RQP46_004905 [Phenoliferia psychrophenolica]
MDPPSELSPSVMAPQRSNSYTGPKPRGILKNAASAKGGAVVWDEENLAVNELAKDSTMKIDEPKTPWVNYNPDTDEVMDLDKIPGFELGRAEDVANGADYNAMGSPPSPSRSAISSGSGTNSRRGSEASEKMVKVEAPHGGPSSGEEDDDDELQDEETRAHRKKFAEKRGGHYKNEAEAMKRAQALLEEEESSGGDGTGTPTNGGAPPPVPPLPMSNGA